MDESSNYYRILVQSGSVTRVMVSGAIFLLYIVAIWLWPFFLPIEIKLCLSVVAALFLMHVWKTHAREEPCVVFLEPNGRVSVVKTLSNENRHSNVQISSSSYVLPWCVQLHLVSAIDAPNQWLTLYNDQLDDVSLRRLRRMVYRAKALD